MIITQKILKELINYNPLTGIFTWKCRARKWFNDDRSFNTWNTKYSNTVAGYIKESNSNKKYYSIGVFNKIYRSHKLAFLYMDGLIPKEIDHKDHDGLNNKWINLRSVTHKENCKNFKLSERSKTGITGVSFCNTRNKFRATINDFEGNRKSLGYFDDIHLAAKVRKEAEIEYGYHKNHGINTNLT